jgi:hypothetical protein
MVDDALTSSSPPKTVNKKGEEKMSRAPIDILLDGVEWKPINSECTESKGLPVVTHEGVLRIYGIELKVYQLNNGVRIIDKEDLNKLLGDNQ